MAERLGRGSIDDSERFYVGSSPVCQDCRHRLGHDHLQCDAFPDRIPVDIWNGRHDHRTSYPGDHGIRFAPMTDEDRRRKRELLEEAAERYRHLTDEMRARWGLPPIDWAAERLPGREVARERGTA